MSTLTLFDAAQQGDIETCKLLLENGADAKAKIEDSMTPLCCAAKNGHTEICKLLLENGADINAKDDSGDTPLAYARRDKRRTEETRKLLQAYGAW